MYILNLYNNSGWILVTSILQMRFKEFIFSRSNCKASVWTLEFGALTLTAVWQCCLRLRSNIPSIHSCVFVIVACVIMDDYIISLWHQWAYWTHTLHLLGGSHFCQIWWKTESTTSIAEGHSTQSHTSGFCLFSWRPGFFSSSKILTDFEFLLWIQKCSTMLNDTCSILRNCLISLAPGASIAFSSFTSP